MIIWCAGCRRKVAYGAVVPPKCSYCDTPLPEKLVADDPQKDPPIFTAYDRKFLKSLRIRAEA